MKSLSKTNSICENRLRYGVYEFHSDNNHFDNDLPLFTKSNRKHKHTLLNANKDGMNFLFRVKGELSPTAIKEFNGIKMLEDKFVCLKEHGCALEYNDAVNTSFYSNLTLINSDLVNASPLTNFRFRLTKPLTDDQIAVINNMTLKIGTTEKTDVTGRLSKIGEFGSGLEFYGIQRNKKGQDVFLENLILVDSCMPQILAWLLLASFTTGERRVDKLTEMISEANPMRFPMTVNKKHYEAKVKRLLLDFALGMLPGQPWEATDLASGVLVVKPSGDIECYHVIYKDTLEEYLFHDLKFETASATRHGFASVECDEEGNQFFALNLQLRFIK